MTNSIQQFNFHSHIVRVEIDEDGNPWFMAKDVCDILGYLNHNNAVKDHCQAKGVSKRYPLQTSGGIQYPAFINEGNLYRLIIKSNKPEAEPFESWVCDEVLPSIRKHGYYIEPNARTEHFSQPYCRDRITSVNKAFHMIPGAVRAGRSLGLSQSDAIIRANQKVIESTGIDVMNLFDMTRQDIELRSHNPIESAGPLISLFVSDWQSGAIEAPFSHCLGSQALRLFHVWAERKNLSIRQGESHLMAALYQHPDLYGKRMYIERGRHIGAKKMLMIDGQKPPHGVRLVDWLAGCVETMEAALKILEAN
jgi:prophage antirepressor-like protein